MKLPSREPTRPRQDATEAAGAQPASGIREQLRGLDYDAQAALLAPVQAKGEAEGDVHGHAARGVAGSGGALPHSRAIQRAFGPHDVSGVQAHVGGDAASACEAIGAEAYATGDKVAFGGQPSLHTAAHEAAHVVQQRAGVSLSGGVGAAGDAYEQHADAVADAVVAGQDAAPLLDRYPGGGGGGAVQRKEDAAEQAGAAESDGEGIRGIQTVRDGPLAVKVTIGRGSRAGATVGDIISWGPEQGETIEVYPTRSIVRFETSTAIVESLRETFGADGLHVGPPRVAPAGGRDEKEVSEEAEGTDEERETDPREAGSVPRPVKRDQRPSMGTPTIGVSKNGDVIQIRLRVAVDEEVHRSRKKLRFFDGEQRLTSDLMEWVNATARKLDLTESQSHEIFIAAMRTFHEEEVLEPQTGQRGR